VTFRDDHEASLARADALEAENERLRDELARMKAPAQAEPKPVEVPVAKPAPVEAPKPRPRPAPPPRVERSYDPRPQPSIDVSTRNKWIIGVVTALAFAGFLSIVLSIV
jgi:hypothetical protein